MSTDRPDRKSTRLNSSHLVISYAVFCLKKKKQIIDEHFVERLTLTNYLVRDIDYWVEYEFAADFSDQFEVRCARRRERGTYLRHLVAERRVVFFYQGRDGVLYRVEVFFPARAP